MEFCMQECGIHATDPGRRWGSGETSHAHPIGIHLLIFNILFRFIDATFSGNHAYYGLLSQVGISSMHAAYSRCSSNYEMTSDWGRATIAKENVFAPMTGKWITAFLADALFTNVLITSARRPLLALLAFRIWKLGKRVTGESRSTVPILRIILDAGVLYSISLLALLMCFVAKNRGHYVMLDLVRP
ncbi:hypothetical protein J3R82DRAFT_8371 [Butyriboletus roseoflavus]|nr:hypothetical protein J3R82DRAFT_8371 [Butyriboletus roseoflavus]